MKLNDGTTILEKLFNSSNIFEKELRLAIFEQNDEKIKKYSTEELNEEYKLLGCCYFSYLGQNFEWTGFYTFYSWFWNDSPNGEYYATYEWYLQDKNKTYGNYIPWTPLHYAIACNKPKSVSILLEKMVDFSKKDLVGRDAIQLAQYLSSDNSAKFYNLSKDRTEIKIKENSNTTEILLLLRILTQSITSSNLIQTEFSKTSHELALNYCLKNDLNQFFIILTKLIFDILPNFKQDKNEEKLYSLYILYHCCIIKSNEFSIFLKLKIHNFDSKRVQHAIKIYQSIQMENPIQFLSLYQESNEQEKILMDYYFNFMRIQFFNNLSFSHLEIDVGFLLKTLNFKNDLELKNSSKTTNVSNLTPKLKKETGGTSKEIIQHNNQTNITQSNEISSKLDLLLTVSNTVNDKIQKMDERITKIENQLHQMEESEEEFEEEN
eukprot:gene9920-2242_t